MNKEIHPILEGSFSQLSTPYSRWKTREVSIGGVPLGGNNPIRVQSMTTIDTMDTMGSVEQAIRMIEAGCEYVRITAPSIKEAQNLENIKKELRNRGYNTPLVADIHFTPNAAEVAAKIVEKVRVNPGNYADKKKFDQIDYTDQEYKAELDRIFKKFSPLVQICKEYGTAMRIGTNHGSLSDRIMSRYGDTPEGMVESAMEFIRICEYHSFHELVISMKSSNPQVMIQAYRLLVDKMIAENMNYPLHLGVTEAGDGEDGRIKSAVGIGTLLEQGLGDTIRISLTEEPEYEIPVAKSLIRKIENLKTYPAEETDKISEGEKVELKPYESQSVNAFIGTGFVPRVVIDYSKENLLDPHILNAVGYKYDALIDKYHMGDQSIDFLYLGDNLPSFTMPGNLKQIFNWNTWQNLKNKANCHPLIGFKEYVQVCQSQEFEKLDTQLNLVEIEFSDIESEDFNFFIPKESLVFVFKVKPEDSNHISKKFFQTLKNFDLKIPVIIKKSYKKEDFSGNWGDLMDVEEPLSKLQIYTGTDFGSLFIEGMGNGLWIDCPSIPVNNLVSTSFAILQATRSRISKTEYISCPSCGRTLFDLQETTQMIRNRTHHLKGLKIGIMGCIVNGPGEMADADYGYVGAGPDKITLYRSKEVVKRNVSSQNALEELIQIIKADGKWVDPQ